MLLFAVAMLLALAFPSGRAAARDAQPVRRDTPATKTEQPASSLAATATKKKNSCCGYRKLSCTEKVVTSNLALCGEGITSDPNHVRFAVIGDYGDGSRCERQVKTMIDAWDKARRLNFIMTVGDNNYEEGKASTLKPNVINFYGKYVKERRFYPALGNHDWYTVKEGSPYKYGTPSVYLNYFSYLASLSPNSDPPVQGRYYKASPHPLLDIFSLDSDFREQDGTCCNSKQASWLKESLANSKAPWKMVFFHHPPYTTARVDAPGYWMRWPYKDWCATSVMSGHEHVYERLSIDGIPYFVNGLGGNEYLYNIEQCTPEPGSQARYNGAHGALLVVANAKQMEFCLYSVNSAEPIDRIRQDLPATECVQATTACTAPQEAEAYCAQQPPAEEPDEPECTIE
jgi:hypothetical protein